MVTGQIVAGAPISAPGAMIWGGSAGNRLTNNWVRAPFQTGTSGNQVIVNLQANFDQNPGGAMDALASASAPFYPSVGSKPPLGCI